MHRRTRGLFDPARLLDRWEEVEAQFQIVLLLLQLRLLARVVVVVLPTSLDNESAALGTLRGPRLRYPCHVTHKDSQRSAEEGTEGPQMEPC